MKDMCGQETSKVKNNNLKLQELKKVKKEFRIEYKFASNGESSHSYPLGRWSPYIIA